MQKTPTYYFLIPGLSDTFQSGGLIVIQDVANIIKNATGAETKFVTTHEENKDALTPLQAFEEIAQDKIPPIFFVTWGPLVKKHIKLIHSKIPRARIIYYAQSFGWNMDVPARIPIICVSKFVMSQWALRAPENYCACIPPPLRSCFALPTTENRDIDIFVQTRKQNSYCLHKLIPALKEKNYKIMILDEWVPQEKFAELLRQSKIFLYITELHKAGLFRRLPGEGFGLPALEALACGTLVGSNLLGGVTDFLSPGENCLKLQNGNIEFDVAQIEKALKNFRVNKETAHTICKNYSREKVKNLWKNLLANL